MFKSVFLSALLAGSAVMGQEKETLSPLKGGMAPGDFREMWAGFDPGAEPLEIETIKEWEEDGVVLRIVRFRIGVFKGQKAKLAAVYGFPKGAATNGKKLPGLVQIHGGGQYADYRAPLLNAKRGYATVSIAWAGRIAAPGYTVNKELVQLFWEGKTDDPNYKLTTDWGALDAYHAPCRNPKNAFATVESAPWTLDGVESPRNNSWFLCALGARRALTFLERQPEVDADKLGVYGHSMGGKLTVMTAAADSRVKAAVPSCGGISDRPTGNALYAATIHDAVSLKHIDCPILFLSPANDFHGRINDLPDAVREIRSQEWRVTCSPHHNHQDTAPYMISGLLWMDQHLKGTITLPQTPESSLILKARSGVPLFRVQVDASKPVLFVDVYYTQDGQMDGERDDMENTIHRFWRHAAAQRAGNIWTADLPLGSCDEPLWVYANVGYALDHSDTGAGYYYGAYTAESFNLSSVVRMVTPEELKAAGVEATLEPSLIIESFEGDWEKEWFTYKPVDWGRRTHKVGADQWKAPRDGKLAFEVRVSRRNRLVVGIDQYATEIELEGGGGWQSVQLTRADFRSAVGERIPGWEAIKELRLGARETLRSRSGGGEIAATLGGDWDGANPEFRNLRWVRE